MRQGSFQWMKSVNKSIILNQIRKKGPISRAQLAKETKLTPPTVSSIVKELIEQRIVEESALGESQGGRKPTMLLINHQAFHVIGVDAGPETIECVLADLSGAILTRTEETLETPLTNEQFLDSLKACIRYCMEGYPDGSGEVLGIGVAMHGVVDVVAGASLYAPNLGLTDIPIKSELEGTFGLEVKVENDARAMALGEYWFGHHGELSSMLAVNIGRGVGAGLIVDGNIYHGSADLAGEIGHMTIDLNGELCECGNHGCLQTFIAGPAIERRASGLVGHHLSAAAAYERAVGGDEALAQLFKETGSVTGIGLTNLIHVINPEKIILGGGVLNAADLMLPAVSEAIKVRALTPRASRTNVEVSRLGADATLIGAVALLLVELFEVD